MGGTVRYKRGFKKAKDKEWIQPRMKNYLMGCCDCGLVHRMDFRIVQGPAPRKPQVQFRASRARNYTAAVRKRERIKVTT